MDDENAMNIRAEKGTKVKVIDFDQNDWGSCDQTKDYLKEDKEYTVMETEVHSYHTKVVLKGQKIAGTFRQYLGENEEDMVILLNKPQKDGAQTIIAPCSEVEVLKAKKTKEKKAAKK